MNGVTGKLAALLLLLTSVSASASVIYSANGGPFTSFTAPYTAANSLTFQFTSPTALASNIIYGTYAGPVSSWTMSDGIYTLSNTTAGVTLSLMLETNAAGSISNWRVEAYNAGFVNDMFILGPIDGPSSSVTGGAGSASNSTLATWTSSSSVPEPESAFLFLGGLFALGVAIGRPKNQSAVFRVGSNPHFSTAARISPSPDI